MTTEARPVPPIAVVALGDPLRRDDGIGLRVMGRVRTLVAEIGCIRTRRKPDMKGSRPRDLPRDVDSWGSRWFRRPQREQRLLAELSLPNLQTAPAPPDLGLIEWIEGGTDPRRLDTVLNGRRRVVLMDAVRLGMPVGTVHHWHLKCSADTRLSEIRHYNGRASMGLQHLALWLEDEVPEGGTDLIGIEPHDLSDGTELSGPISSRLPAISSQVAAIMVRILEEEGW